MRSPGPRRRSATSEYVAPEQIRRQRGQPSVDIYALGAMLYEMLTGHPPFENDDPFVVASARQIGDPKAPRELDPSISVQAEEIVLRALRRDPAERYASAAALKADLDAPAKVVVSGLSAHLVAVTRARKALRVARFVTLNAVAPIALLVVAFLLLRWSLDRRPRSHAPHPHATAIAPSNGAASSDPATRPAARGVGGPHCL